MEPTHPGLSMQGSWQAALLLLDRRTRLPARATGATIGRWPDVGGRGDKPVTTPGYDGRYWQQMVCARCGESLGFNVSDTPFAEDRVEAQIRCSQLVGSP